MFFFFMCNINVLNKVCYVLDMVYNTHFNFIYLINKKMFENALICYL